MFFSIIVIIQEVLKINSLPDNKISFQSINERKRNAEGQ